MAVSLNKARTPANFLGVLEKSDSSKDRSQSNLTIIVTPVAKIEEYLQKKYGSKLAPCCSV